VSGKRGVPGHGRSDRARKIPRRTWIRPTPVYGLQNRPAAEHLQGARWPGHGHAVRFKEQDDRWAGGPDQNRFVLLRPPPITGGDRTYVVFPALASHHVRRTRSPREICRSWTRTTAAAGVAFAATFVESRTSRQHRHHHQRPQPDDRPRRPTCGLYGGVHRRLLSQSRPGLPRRWAGRWDDVVKSWKTTSQVRRVQHAARGPYSRGCPGGPGTRPSKSEPPIGGRSVYTESGMQTASRHATSRPFLIGSPSSTPNIIAPARCARHVPEALRRQRAPASTRSAGRGAPAGQPARRSRAASSSLFFFFFAASRLRSIGVGRTRTFAVIDPRRCCAPPIASLGHGRARLPPRRSGGKRPRYCRGRFSSGCRRSSRDMRTPSIRPSSRSVSRRN